MTLWRVGATMAVWAALSALLWVSDANPAVLVLGAIVAVIAASVFVTVDFGKAVVRVVWPERRVHKMSSRDRRVTRLLRDAHSVGRSDSTQLHDTLVELVDDRLLAHHDIDRAAAPEAAMTILTPTLGRLVCDPRLRTAKAHELRRILSDIEAL